MLSDGPRDNPPTSEELVWEGYKSLLIFKKGSLVGWYEPRCVSCPSTVIVDEFLKESLALSNQMSHFSNTGIFLESRNSTCYIPFSCSPELCFRAVGLNVEHVISQKYIWNSCRSCVLGFSFWKDFNFPSCVSFSPWNILQKI